MLPFPTWIFVAEFLLFALAFLGTALWQEWRFRRAMRKAQRQR